MTYKFLCLLIACILLSQAASSQIDYDKIPDVTTTVLINDVHIQVSPVDSFGLGDILIEDGVIVQVAKSIDAPYDAEVIEADSAYAYAAFIDPLSHTGIPKPEKGEEKPKVKFPGYPPNAVAGITPEKNAAELIDHKNSSIKSMREAGYAISHSVPYGRMLPGMGSIISLYGDTNEEMILQEKVSMFFQFTGARGFYPSTVIGVMAKWRDMYRKASYLDKHQSSYKSDETIRTRPKANKSLQALIPVTKKEMAVFHKTEKSKDIHRAIALQKDLDYKLVLTGVKHITPAIEKVKSSGAYILLNPTLPKKEKEAKDKEKEKKKDKKNDKQNDKKEEKKGEAKDIGTEGDNIKDSDKKKKETEDDPETKALKAKKKKSYDAYIAQAGELEKNGVPFAFSMMDAKVGDLNKNIRTMIEAGLSHEGALAALTTHPAKILGIDAVSGTIQKGKMGNIVITDMPLFEEKTAVKYVFVEGHKTEIEKKKDKKAKSGDSDGEVKSSLVGKWSYEVEVPGDTQSGIMEISSDGKVEIVSDDTPGEVDVAISPEFDEDNVTFELPVDMGGTMMNLGFDLTFDGDSFEGTVDVGQFGSFPISGSKESGPE